MKPHRRNSLPMRMMMCLALLMLSIGASAQTLKPVKDRQTKKYGYQDKQKNWVIPPTFDDANRFNDDGFAQVKLDGRYGLINPSGEWVLMPEYDDIGKFDKNGFCELKVKEGKVKMYGVADITGRVLLPPVFHSVDVPRSGECLMASLEMDQDGLRGTALWGVFDRNGQEIYSPQFLSQPSVSDGIVIGKNARTGLYGAGDLGGNILLPFEFLSISRYGGGFRTLDRCFTQASYNNRFQRAESFRQPGAVVPYDVMDDKVRAAAWHSGLVGTRLHPNQVRAVEMQPGHSSRHALCRELDVDWGYGRFLRLEPFATDGSDPDAMADPVSGRSYTLKAMLYEADGTLVGEVTDRGWLEAECREGVIYNAGGLENWLVLTDPNSLALPSFSLNLSGYRALAHDNIYNGLGIRSYDLERLDDVRSYAGRLTAIVEGENTGVTSYLPPEVDMRDARMERDVMRADLFYHPFHMGEAVSCELHDRGEELEVELYNQLVIRFEDRFQDPYYSMDADELIYWGPHNARTLRLSLEATYSSDALADDVAGTGKHWGIVLSLYEEDGSWLRTLARAPYATFAQDGVLVFKELGIALLAPYAVKEYRDTFGWSSYQDLRGQVMNTLKLPHPQPMPHTVSALESFRLRGFPPSHGGRGTDPARPRFDGRR